MTTYKVVDTVYKSILYTTTAKRNALVMQARYKKQGIETTIITD